jgi:uncharacterized damage-inducible protein DinB
LRVHGVTDRVEGMTEQPEQPGRKHPDMWLDPEDDPRDTGQATPLGERGMVLDYLRHYRLTFELKLQGLDAEQLARRSVPPSSMSLLGLLRHLAGVEHHWFRNVMQGDPAPRPYRIPENRDHDFDGAVGDPSVVAEAWTAWRSAVADAETFTDAAESLDVLGVMSDGARLELREVLVHMIEEYARHCGHADLLRECVDGRTGQ